MKSDEIKEHLDRMIEQLRDAGRDAAEQKRVKTELDAFVSAWSTIAKEHLQDARGLLMPGLKSLDEGLAICKALNRAWQENELALPHRDLAEEDPCEFVPGLIRENRDTLPVLYLELVPDGYKMYDAPKAAILDYLQREGKGMENSKTMGAIERNAKLATMVKRYDKEHHINQAFIQLRREGAIKRVGDEGKPENVLKDKDDGIFENQRAEWYVD